MMESYFAKVRLWVLGMIPWHFFRKFFLVVSLLGILFACSDDGGDSEDPPEVEVDLSVVEGRYRGNWEWVFGEGPISMIIRPGNDANTYEVQFFESPNFTPRNQMDGVSPDARGDLTVTDMNVSIDLVYSVNDPPCSGMFTGMGTLSAMGALDLTMNIDDCFANNVAASWVLVKIENL
ncbi:MAG: hypothetical protein AAF717_16775 [Bacteroidota bacterium]